jgi:hypothetical protein
MAFDRFTPEGVVFFLPEVIPGWKDLKEPITARFYSAHFCFTLGQFSTEVQHDPEFYFHGEEISITVRAYTHGYDLFHPHKVVIWHEYTRKGRVKQWDDDKEWYKKNTACHKKNRQLLGIDGEIILNGLVLKEPSEIMKNTLEYYLRLEVSNKKRLIKNTHQIHMNMKMKKNGKNHFQVYSNTVLI